MPRMPSVNLDYPEKQAPGGTVYTIPGWYIEAVSGAALGAGNLLHLPIFVARAFTYIGICMRVTASAVGAARLGIYKFANGVPTTLVLDAGTIDTGSIGLKEIVISQYLARGWYTLCFVANSAPTLATPLVTSAVTIPHDGHDFGSTGRTFNICLYTTGRVGDVAGGLANPAPAISGGADKPELVFLRES